MPDRELVLYLVQCQAAAICLCRSVTSLLQNDHDDDGDGGGDDAALVVPLWQAGGHRPMTTVHCS
jgi:hypothetical protein